VCTQNLDSDVVVMKSAKNRIWIDDSGPLNWSPYRLIFVERPICPDFIVVSRARCRIFRKCTSPNFHPAERYRSPVQDGGITSALLVTDLSDKS
jgi:hypothetical protein